MSRAMLGDRRSLRGSWILVGLLGFLAAHLLGMMMSAFCGGRGIRVVPVMQQRRTALEALPVLPLDVPTQVTTLTAAGGACLSAATAVGWRLIARRRRQWQVIPEKKRLRRPLVAKGSSPAVAREVVLLGKTGCGKSLLGNVMLKRYDAFKSDCSTSSVTKGVDMQEARILSPDHRQMDLTVHDTRGLLDTTTKYVRLNMMQDFRSFCADVAKLWEQTQQGVNVFVYVVRNDRCGELDGWIARCTTKYLFDGEEQKPNLVIVMTHCNRKQLKFSKQEKAEWLEHQCEENKDFRFVYEMVDKDPSRFFMVDNQDEEDMRKQNQKGIAPLWRYILTVDSALNWQDAGLLKRLCKLDKEIKDLKGSEEEKDRLLKVAKKKLEEELANKVKERAESDESNPDAGCFGGLCEVSVRNKGTIQMNDLAIGDMVNTGAGWSPVVAWLHRCTDVLVDVLEIETGAGPLLATSEHLLFRADGSTVPAYAVQCNDKLASEGGRIAVVNSVRHSKSLGYYAPLTQSGQIQVSGVRCSCYIETGFSHVAMNLAMLPLRWAPGWMSPWAEMSSEQIHDYAKFLMMFYFRGRVAKSRRSELLA